MEQQQLINGGKMNAMTPLSANTARQPINKDEVRIMEESSILDQIKEVRSLTSECCIPQVPDKIRKENPEAFTPRMVSIGPLHHDLQRLRPMETRKVQYLQNFLSRESQATLADYIKAITSLEQKARQCYPEVNFSPDRFVKKMVVDGCFILELLLSVEDYTMSSMKWIFRVFSYLILIENQIPFFVLEELYQLYVGHGQVNGLHHLHLSELIRRSLVLFIVQQLLCKDAPSREESPRHNKPKHLLDFVRYFLIPSSPIPSKLPDLDGNQSKNLSKRLRCATELEKASIRFDKNMNLSMTDLMDIKFDEGKGLLTIRSIKIGHGTERILRNLVAYEQYTDDYSYITEYAGFVDRLIDTRKDVEMLQEHGIIETVLGDPGEVAALFNNLLKDVVVPLFVTWSVRTRVDRYYNKPCHKWKASLMLNYFNTPWASIPVVAAVILLALTIIQTIYTLLAFYM